MRRWAMVVAVLAFVTMGMSCEMPQPSADDEMAHATTQAMGEANRQVGMPDIINWTERRQFKDILELRDKPDLATFTYIVDMNANLRPLCRSIGYGLPYSVQYTNPMVTVDTWRANGFLEQLPQPDPNGLFMPDGLSATWVLCVDPESGTPDPVYVEPQIIVSRFELSLADWDNPGGRR